jgi:nucleoside-diphosphate-sugar epimerase
MKRKALITGSEGFIGRHLKAKLDVLGWEVFCWDMVDSKDVRDVAKFNNNVDFVFHLAGISDEKSFKSNILDSFDINITGTLAVLNYCKKNDAKCIFASTSGVYNSSNKKVDELSDLNPSSPYAISKYLAERICYQFSKEWNIPITVLRIFNVFGAEQPEPFIVPYVVNKLINGNTIEIKMPEAVRDFIHISDVIDAMILSATHSNKNFNIYNIGTGISTRIIDLITTAEKIYDKKADIIFNKSNEGKPCNIVADNSKALKELGWKINFDLQRGLVFYKPIIDKIGLK